MNTDTASDLNLNIGDRVKVFFNTDAFVQIVDKCVDISFEKKAGDDWIAYESFTGILCRQNYKKLDLSLDVVKLRIDTPMRVTNTRYLTLSASDIKKIEVLEKKKPGVLGVLAQRIGELNPRFRSDISEFKPGSSL